MQSLPITRDAMLTATACALLLLSNLLKNGPLEHLTGYAGRRRRGEVLADPLGRQTLHTFPAQHLNTAWWSWSGSNRRPTACKAAALPAELQPPGPETLGGSGWVRTTDPRLIKTVL